jgi:leucyl aminopeptidase (aminopeptidase T)
MSNLDLQYASVLISDCLRIQPGEEVLIFVDNDKLKIASDLSYFIKKLGASPSVFYIPNTVRPIETITDIQSIALISADVVIYILETKGNEIDLSKEVSFRHFLYSLPIQYKGRVCMMPAFSDDMKKAVMIDYGRLNDTCIKLSQIIMDKTITIKSNLGTDVEFSLLGREIKIDNGDISKVGSFGNIPAGEIFTAPVEDSINGTIVVDGSIGGLGKVYNPIFIELSSGQIKDIHSYVEDDILEKFRKICEYDLPATKTVGEFGIGLNSEASIIGTMLMDEKVQGTVHFAFGDSYNLGKSKSKFHTDVLIKNPSIFIKNHCIMKNGKFDL